MRQNAIREITLGEIPAFSARIRAVGAAAIRYHHWPLLSIVSASLFAGILATWQGINYFFDSSFYLWYAQRIQAGAGLSLPLSSYQAPDLMSWISGWPPLYPVFLALGGEPIVWARTISIGLLVVAALLTYGLALRLTHGARGMSTAATLLMLSIPSFTREAFAFARSETLFVTLVMGALLLMSYYRPGFNRPALYAALLTALAMLTRYLGVALAGALVTCVAWRVWQERASIRALLLPLMYFALAFVPLGIYIVYLWGLTGYFSGSQPIYDPIHLGDILASLRIIALQLLHGIQFALQTVGLRSNWWVLGGGTALAMVVGWRGWRRRDTLRRMVAPAHGLVLLYVVFYLGMLWVSCARSVAIHAEARHFVPLFPVLAVVVTQIVARTMPRPAAYMLLALCLIGGTVSLFEIRDGLRHNDHRWRENAILNTLDDTLPPKIMLHSMHAASLALQLVTDVPFRSFGGDQAFIDYACSDVLYPPGYNYAGFVLVDAAMFRDHSAAAVDQFFREWAMPCGTVDRLDYDGFVLLLIIDLGAHP